MADSLGREARIVALARRPCPYASSFHLEEIDLRLADRTELRLVMKDLGRQGLAESARRARPAFLYEPRREIHAYRDILPFAPAGTPSWYGVVPAAADRGPGLLLERVDGLELRHVGEPSVWDQTVRWVARFHAVFATEGLGALARRLKLLVYDEAFYWSWIERAVRFSARRPAHRRIIERIARGYARVVERLMAMPQTLIHGELYPCNVLIRGAGDRVRVCPVDWELAALGPALMDVASLTTGWRAGAQRALLRAYCTARHDEASGPARVSRDVLEDLDCCRLHLAARMLGWSKEWTPPPQHAHDWLAEAAQCAARMRI